MSLFEDLVEDFSRLTTIKPVTGIVIILLTGSLITPGILILFLFERQLFISVNIVKLIFLSFSISFPYFLGGGLVGMMIFNINKKPLNLSWFASLLSLVFAYMSIGIIYILSQN